MCNDSMRRLHRICQIPTNCLYERRQALPTAGETFVNTCPSPEKFQFCTDKIVSIEWRNLVPWLRICDCFKIHHLHQELCDLLSSSHRTFVLEALLRQSASCKEHSYLGSLPDLAISVFREVVTNTVLPWHHFDSSDSESWEVFAGVSLDAGTSVCSRFSVHSSNHSGRSRIRLPDAWLLSLFLFLFLVLLGSRRFFDARAWVSSLPLYCWTWRDLTWHVLRYQCRRQPAARAGGTCWQSWDKVRNDVFRTATNNFTILSQLFFFFCPQDNSNEYPCSSQSLPDDRTAGVSSRICTDQKRSRSWTYPVASNGCNNRRKVSWSLKWFQFHWT